jgi:hypothetical protein
LPLSQYDEEGDYDEASLKAAGGLSHKVLNTGSCEHNNEPYEV